MILLTPGERPAVAPALAPAAARGPRAYGPPGTPSRGGVQGGGPHAPSGDRARRPPPAAACRLAWCLAWCLVWVVPARAQSVDHGDLEQLFGEPVTTSATGKPQRASQVPANMEIITAEQIRRSGYDNLPDILRLVPGVDVRRYGFAAAEVGIRGYNRPSNPRLLVLVNGQQVYLDDYGRTQWFALPVELDEIRQIEVVKGPNSALYGFNAVSGVVNIVTYDPLRDRVNAATARAGTQEYGALSAVGTAGFADRAGVRVSAGGLRARDFVPGRLDPLTLSRRVEPRRGSVAADARFRIAPGVEAALSGSLVDLRSFEPVASPYHAASRYRTDAVRGALTAETGLGVLGLNVYRNHLDYAYDGGVSRSRLDNAVTVVQASDLVKPGADHAVRLGLEFRDNVQAIPAYGSRVGYRLYAAGLMWDWQVTPRLSQTVAVRVDRLALRHSGPLLMPGPGRTGDAYDRRRITDVSFNAGLVWRATDEDTLRLTLVRGLQAPSLFALGQQHLVPATRTAPAISLLGSPDLDPSVVSHAELGYDRRVGALASTLRAAVFAQRTDDVIADPFSAKLVPTRQGIVYRSANIGDSSAAGGEIGLRGGAGGWRWNASYAYVSVSDRLDAASRLSFRRATPTHVVLLGGGYTWGRFEADIQGRWQSRYRDVAVDARSTFRVSVGVPDYVQLDARVGYKVAEGLTVALTANRFNGSRLMQTAGRPVERRIFLSLSARL